MLELQKKFVEKDGDDDDDAVVRVDVQTVWGDLCCRRRLVRNNKELLLFWSWWSSMVLVVSAPVSSSWFGILLKCSCLNEKDSIPTTVHTGT